MRFKKVLIIDDDEFDVYVSKRIIKSSDFTEVLITTATVKDAMDYLANNHTNGTLPEIIFLDLNMPGENGLDFLNRFSVFAEEEKISCIIALLMNVVQTEDPVTKQAKVHPLVNYIFEKPLTVENLKSIRASR